MAPNPAGSPTQAFPFARTLAAALQHQQQQQRPQQPQQTAPPPLPSASMHATSEPPAVTSAVSGVALPRLPLPPQGPSAARNPHSFAGLHALAGVAAGLVQLPLVSPPQPQQPAPPLPPPQPQQTAPPSPPQSAISPPPSLAQTSATHSAPPAAAPAADSSVVARTFAQELASAFAPGDKTMAVFLSAFQAQKDMLQAQGEHVEQYQQLILKLVDKIQPLPPGAPPQPASSTAASSSPMPLTRQPPVSSLPIPPPVLRHSPEASPEGASLTAPVLSSTQALTQRAHGARAVVSPESLPPRVLAAAASLEDAFSESASSSMQSAREKRRGPACVWDYAYDGLVRVLRDKVKTSEGSTFSRKDAQRVWSKEEGKVLTPHGCRGRLNSLVEHNKLNKIQESTLKEPRYQFVEEGPASSHFVAPDGGKNPKAAYEPPSESEDEAVSSSSSSDSDETEAPSKSRRKK